MRKVMALLICSFISLSVKAVNKEEKWNEMGKAFKEFNETVANESWRRKHRQDKTELLKVINKVKGGLSYWREFDDERNAKSKDMVRAVKEAEKNCAKVLLILEKAGISLEQKEPLKEDSSDSASRQNYDSIIFEDDLDEC